MFFQCVTSSPTSTRHYHRLDSTKGTSGGLAAVGRFSGWKGRRLKSNSELSLIGDVPIQGCSTVGGVFLSIFYYMNSWIGIFFPVAWLLEDYIFPGWLVCPRGETTSVPWMPNAVDRRITIYLTSSIRPSIKLASVWKDQQLRGFLKRIVSCVTHHHPKLATKTCIDSIKTLFLPGASESTKCSSMFTYFMRP